METKEIILIVCALITSVSSVLWEINNGAAKAMRALNLGIGLILSVICIGSIVKGMEAPFVVYPALICSGLISLMMLMSKGQSLFAILIRLAHFINVIGVVMYLMS
jgi:hypothetical protein